MMIIVKAIGFVVISIIIVAIAHLMIEAKEFLVLHHQNWRNKQWKQVLKQHRKLDQ